MNVVVLKLELRIQVLEMEKVKVGFNSMEESLSHALLSDLLF